MYQTVMGRYGRLQVTALVFGVRWNQAAWDPKVSEFSPTCSYSIACQSQLPLAETAKNCCVDGEDYAERMELAVVIYKTTDSLHLGWLGTINGVAWDYKSTSLMGLQGQCV